MINLQRVAICLISTLFAATAPVDGANSSLKPQQQVGERVTDFNLPVVGGEHYVTLSEEYKQGSVVVVVLRGYPGYQCPICTRQVSALSNRAKSLAKDAHRVILVYPGESSDLKKRAEAFLGARKLPPPMVMVRDDNMDLIRQWGLHWDKRMETAYPATYVIDSNGIIRAAHVDKDYTKRMEPADILAALRALKS